ncbi:MAG TPA: GGDEF domain-containing protein [Spirochaetota bacterium]|nr:GGDEF domain-containing protein [Spirochaetota bacterium]
MDDIIKFLQNVEIFSTLTTDEINQIVNNSRFVEYNAGDVLFREGDEGHELYIVENGIVTISIDLQNGTEKELAAIHSGDFLGEMSIFEDAPRSASCYAKTKTRLLMLNQNEFFQMIDQHPEIAVKIMYRMLNITTRRLRNTNEFVADTVRWGEEARRRAITDELTGVYNRRYLDEVYKKQCELAMVNKSTLTMIMVDLDHFRDINDQYGNDVGDELLREVVKIFRKHFRHKDFIARYGGDEFTVLMPGEHLTESIVIAGRVCEDIACLAILEKLKGDIKQLTTSQGIAAYPDCTDEAAELRVLADKALYSAKENGRNRVVSAPLK